ncbi:MAG: RDD family protein [Chloroflexi bacterium]|nr:RDD family protein [Chloroflexota bacterium]
MNPGFDTPIMSASLSTKNVTLPQKGVGVFRRLGAWLIDLAIFLLVNNLFMLIFGVLTMTVITLRGGHPRLGEGGSRALNLLVGLLSITAYSTLCEWLYGATPGKALLKIRVIDEEGSSLNFSSALIRAILRLVDGLFLGLPALFSMREPLNQRLGDRAAHTIVVYSQDPAIHEHPRMSRLFLALALYCVVASISSLVILSQMI